MAGIITRDSRFLMSPQNDLTFKILFGSEKNAHLLSFLVSSLTGVSPGEITILNPFLLRNYPLEKESVLDINGRTEQGYQIFIEMQRSRLLSIPERMLFYWAKAHASQEIKGKDYFSLKRTIGICILGFPLYFYNEPVSCFQTLERKEYERLCENLDLYFFQLGNNNYTKAQNNTNDVWAWRTFLGAKTEEEMIMAAQASEAVNEAFELLKGLSEKKEIQAIYEARERFLLDQATREREAREEGLIEGEKKGLIEGEKKGLIKGEKKGREEGREEGRKETINEIVLHMNESGISPESIVSITGLSHDEVKKIIKE